MRRVCMKRILPVLLCAVFCMFCLVGCGEKTDKYGFYAQSTLNKNFIPDLPKRKSDNKQSVKDGRFQFTATQEEFNEYLNAVYEYLVSCSFDYFGYPTKVLGTFFGGAPKCSFAYGNELHDFQTDIAISTSSGDLSEQAAIGTHYFFVWGNEGVKEQSDGSRQIVNAKYLQIGCRTDGQGEQVSAYMRLKHTLMDYTFYLIVDESQTKI